MLAQAPRDMVRSIKTSLTTIDADFCRKLFIT
jgi:hypothetical protein